MKDKRPNKDKKNVVYKIDCSECDIAYIGETGRDTKTRIKEHQKYIEKKNETSAIYQHNKATGDRMNWEELEILEQNNDFRKQMFIEAG